MFARSRPSGSPTGAAALRMSSSAPIAGTATGGTAGGFPSPPPAGSGPNGVGTGGIGLLSTSGSSSGSSGGTLLHLSVPFSSSSRPSSSRWTRASAASGNGGGGGDHLPHPRGRRRGVTAAAAAATAVAAVTLAAAAAITLTAAALWGGLVELDALPAPVGDTVRAVASRGSGGGGSGVSPPPTAGVVPSPVELLPGSAAAGGETATSPVPARAVTRPVVPPAACASGRARGFLLVFMGHSGSSALMSQLAAHSGISIPAAEAVDHGIFRRNSSAALARARHIFSSAAAEGKVGGFKIRPWHIEADPGAWRALAREAGVRLLWNVRGNVVKAAVGEYTARVLNDSSAIEGLRPGTEAKRCSTGAGCTFEVEDMDALYGLMRMFVESDARVSRAVTALAAREPPPPPPPAAHDGGAGSAPPPPAPARAAAADPLCAMTVTYEEYLASSTAVVTSVLAFLGLPPEVHPPSRAKATNDALCVAVRNYGSLCDAFYGCTAWRWMLDDVANGCRCAVAARGGQGWAGGVGSKYCGVPQ